MRSPTPHLLVIIMRSPRSNNHGPQPPSWAKKDRPMPRSSRCHEFSPGDRPGNRGRVAGGDRGSTAAYNRHPEPDVKLLPEQQLPAVSHRLNGSGKRQRPKGAGMRASRAAAMQKTARRAKEAGRAGKGHKGVSHKHAPSETVRHKLDESQGVRVRRPGRVAGMRRARHNGCCHTAGQRPGTLSKRGRARAAARW